MLHFLPCSDIKGGDELIFSSPFLDILCHTTSIEKSTTATITTTTATFLFFYPEEGNSPLSSLPLPSSFHRFHRSLPLPLLINVLIPWMTNACSLSPPPTFKLVPWPLVSQSFPFPPPHTHIEPLSPSHAILLSFASQSLPHLPSPFPSPYRAGQMTCVSVCVSVLPISLSSSLKLLAHTVERHRV